MVHSNFPNRDHPPFGGTRKRTRGVIHMPEPLTPAECDLRGFAFMPLDVVRLGDSDLIALSSGEEFKAAVMLWCKAWLQVPAASLPDDDRILARLSGAGRKWPVLREMALHGFILCDDGRLYHPVVAEKALDAWERRSQFAEQRDRDRERMREWRQRKRQRNEAVTRESVVTEPEPGPNGTSKTGTGSETGTYLPFPDGSGAPDPEKVMFDGGRRLLAEAGIPQAKAGSLLGKWKRDHGAAAVIAALGRAQREGAIEPVAFIEGCLRAQRKGADHDPDRITI
jgi:hypothetical protein